MLLEELEDYSKINKSTFGFDDCCGWYNNFGYSLANLGDLRNDGLTALAVGQGNNNGDHSAAWILYLNEFGELKAFQVIPTVSETEYVLLVSGLITCILSGHWEYPMPTNSNNIVMFLIIPPKCMYPREFTTVFSSY